MITVRSPQLLRQINSLVDEVFALTGETPDVRMEQRDGDAVVIVSAGETSRELTIDIAALHGTIVVQGLPN